MTKPVTAVLVFPLGTNSFGTVGAADLQTHYTDTLPSSTTAPGDINQVTS